MKSLPVLLFSGFSLCAQTPDLYPQVRSLVLEAKALSTNMRLLKDRSNPHTWAGDILAHAGYLEDAERAYAKSPGPSGDPPYILWRAWVVYGHRERAEKLLESTTNPEKRAAYGAAFADLLWRMGQPAQLGNSMKPLGRSQRRSLIQLNESNRLGRSIKVSSSCQIHRQI